MKLEETIARRVREMLKEVPVHGWDHTLRVYAIAKKLAKKYKADELIVSIAALLHDIGRAYKGKRHHALISAEIAKEWLEDEGVPKEIINAVCKAILAHSFSLGYEADTLEAKIVSDADKLDAIGAIGIARCFMESTLRKRGISVTIKHFNEKLLKLKDLMYTEEAKKMALKRHKFMLYFLSQLKEELREATIDDDPQLL